MIDMKEITITRKLADAYPIDAILTVHLMLPAMPVEEEKNQSEGDTELVKSLMNIILSLRQEARAAKNWKVADKIRDELKKSGIMVEDTPQGATWHRV